MRVGREFRDAELDEREEGRVAQVFAEPGRLLWLVAALGLAGWVARGARRLGSEWRALGLGGEPPPTGAWAWWGASVFLILALGAPRWGRVAGSELPPGHDVVLLVDVSRSMGAQDAAPTRLGLARSAARGLLAQLRREPGDRAALVAFAGRAVARCPLTANLDAVLDSLAELRPGMIEPGGTDLGAGLTTALDAFDAIEHADGRAIVVFSDGEDHADTWPSVVGRLVAAEVVTHVVAVGDADKLSPVPPAGSSPSPGAADPAPLTRRVDAPLTQLAQATGGAMVPLGVATGDLGALYRDRIEPMVRGHRPAPPFRERAERFPICLSLALVLGLLGTYPPARRHRSGRWRWGLGGGRSWGRSLVVAAVATALVLASLGAEPATPRSRAEAATIRGLAASREGRLADALTAFEVATTARPTNPVGPFDAASVLFALGRYPEAVARYGVARGLATRPRLTAKIDYALGNSLAMVGQFPEAIRHYDACLAVARTDPNLAALARDAAVNREFVLARIEPPPDDPGGGGGDADPDSGDRKSPRADRSPPSSRSPRTLADGAPNPATADPNQGPGSGPSGSRGAGGAGGGGAAPPDGGTPGGRLDAALQRIRAAKEQRPAAPPPSSPGPRNAGKDW